MWRESRRRRRGSATALGCELTETTGGTNAAWQVTLPSWRSTGARDRSHRGSCAVYGYNALPTRYRPSAKGAALPWRRRKPKCAHAAAAASMRRSATLLLGGGGGIDGPQPGLVVPIGNRSATRPECCVLSRAGNADDDAGNLHRDVNDVRLFELGAVFSGRQKRWRNGRPSLWSGGSLPEQSALHAARLVGFHDVKESSSSCWSAFSTGRILRPLPGRGWAYADGCILTEPRGCGGWCDRGWFGSCIPRGRCRKLKEPVLW